MAITTLKVLASLLQLHGPGASLQSDHPGIDALLNDLRDQDLTDGTAAGQIPTARPEQPEVKQVYFRRGAFAKGPHAGAFRRGGGGYYGGGRYYGGAGAFRRGGFIRGY
ncbi:hypothetical protein JQ543_12625 [Bradyrhizobium diazoefficiens]|nr:hypothetical protein [Bradyrhizobium diazoefficiens]MBR0773375.1 hypothetical protein [Bradyrhizobium diazoefficiens]MBR0848589.1 hypothetical protein [Bradyrhizobium diazoefficiens]